MPGFALSPRLIKIRDNYSNDEFFRDLFIVAGVIFSGGVGLGTGAGSVAARGFIGKIANSGYIKLKGNIGFFLGTLFAKIAQELLEWAKGGDLNADAAVKALIFETTGLELETLNVEGAKRALGKKLADDINLKYGTNFSPFYPPENVIDEVKNQVISELINSVATNAPPPSRFKFLTNTVAQDITNQIINRYKAIHNLPTIASGVILPSTVARVKNKISQASYRQNNTRFSEWRNDDNATILNHYQSRLQALRVAKKAYRLAASNYAKAVSGFNNGIVPAGNLATYLAIKNNKQAIFTAAQRLNYTGDGTTL